MQKKSELHKKSFRSSLRCALSAAEDLDFVKNFWIRQGKLLILHKDKHIVDQKNAKNNKNEKFWHGGKLGPSS